MANEVLRDLSQAQPREPVNLKVEPGQAAVADPKYIRIVLENLLGNAWKYTGKTAETSIEFGRLRREPDAEPIWFVRDNGAGFDMRYAEKLFGVFQRLHTAHDFPGNGVGLATVRRILAKHGGRIWAEAEPERGATFFFTLGQGEPPESETPGAVADGDIQG
jgi:light-regulated signal transduction histidine kinase (bacteriophytochrome)